MKFPKDLNSTILELYIKDPLEFEARHIYGLKKTTPFKRFVKKIDSVDDAFYDEAIFWGYQKKRILDRLNVTPLYKSISAPLGPYLITERLDYLYDETVVCFTMHAPSKESLRLALCGYCVQKVYNIANMKLECWWLKGYKEVIEKVSYPLTLIDDKIELLNQILDIKKEGF